MQDEIVPKPSQTQETEQIVRDAKQRFRDTLPKGYLNAEEYALYERWYGSPLRETEPEDVGIDTHYDMGLKSEKEGTVLRELEGGEFEEVKYHITPPAVEEIREEDDAIQEEEDILREELEPSPEELEAAALAELVEEAKKAEQDVEDAVRGLDGAPKAEDKLPDDMSPDEMQALQNYARAMVENEESTESPGYAETIARSERERVALQKLTEQYAVRKEIEEELQEKLRAEEQEKRLKEVLVNEEDAEDEGEFVAVEDPDLVEHEEIVENPQRFHPYTLEASFHDKPIRLTLPRDELVDPVQEAISRTHPKHIRTAAHRAFGGEGMPTAPGKMGGQRTGSNMTGLGLTAGQRHMSEIEADVFLAAVLPPTYASIFSILREVRKRNGSNWIQSKLKDGSGISVLDAGSGGAGLLAWDQIVKAEWEILLEKGEVGPKDTMPGKKTTIAGSGRLVERIKTFLHDTTILSRLPDYEHSGQTRGPRLEGGDKEQPKKSYDLVIASHLLLTQPEGHRRQAILNLIWHLVKKDGGILVIQERAHVRGFEAMAHARDTIINQFLLKPDGQPRIMPEEFNSTFHREPEPGRIIAPCTNQGVCPMYQVPGKATGRKDICHFNQRFIRPKFFANITSSPSGTEGDVDFSYVVVQRGVFPTTKLGGKEAVLKALEGYEKADEMPNHEDLPRMILPGLKRKGHVTLDVCTPNGQIEKWTVPKSFSKLAYHDARKSKWGDLWPLGAKTRTLRSTRQGEVEQTSKRGKEGSKKERRIELTMLGGGKMEARQKNALPDRKAKHKKRERDPMREIQEEEALETADRKALEEELDAIEEQEWEQMRREQTSGRE
ncbi:hypothetical protein N3K66_000738 [Trichothecium roseum]|uniref:Uncharacterized protein n=1 Tax=Trichothecium roseum TaxID=47278 RepID=A0ACC0VCS1_9HYPO|nr:hypothetical protein N3K66_000738 [Trichothecium roseum]